MDKIGNKKPISLQEVHASLCLWGWSAYGLNLLSQHLSQILAAGNPHAPHLLRSHTRDRSGFISLKIVDTKTSKTPRR